LWYWLINWRISSTIIKISDCPSKSLFNNDSSIEIEHEKNFGMKNCVNLQLVEKVYFDKRENWKTVEEWINSIVDA